MYARRLTKEELMNCYGITNVTEDGRVFIGDNEVKTYINNGGYMTMQLSEIGKDKASKLRTVGLHRVMYAWHSKEQEVPEGLIVDHINNKHSDIEDYYMSNLQLLTPAENVAKDKNNWHVSELKCDLSKPRSHYEQKLEGYTAAYEQAKKDKDAKAAHQFRTYVAQTRARLRYYDSHIKDYETKSIEKKLKSDCHARAAKRRELQAEIDKTRLFYLQLKEAYGKDDEYVKQVWGEWKLAIARLNVFKEEHKRVK